MLLFFVKIMITLVALTAGIGCFAFNKSFSANDFKKDLFWEKIADVSFFICAIAALLVLVVPFWFIQ